MKMLGPCVLLNLDRAEPFVKVGTDFGSEVEQICQILALSLEEVTCSLSLYSLICKIGIRVACFASLL